jgi:hypothetical protein
MSEAVKAFFGRRQFLDDLDEARRTELRRRLMADLESRERIVLRRYAWLLTLPLREG